jgi:hypothetical protein
VHRIKGGISGSPPQILHQGQASQRTQRRHTPQRLTPPGVTSEYNRNIVGTKSLVGFRWRVRSKIGERP